MSPSPLDHRAPAPPLPANARAGRWFEDTVPDVHRAPGVAAAPDLQPAAALLDAATRMHASADPAALLHLMAVEALDVVATDGVVVLSGDRNGPTPVLDLPGAGTGTPAHGATTTTRCLRLRDAHLLEPGRIADLDRHLRPFEGSGRLEPVRWRSLLIADLGVPQVRHPTLLLWYARTPDAFTTTAADLAVLFARHAGLALQAVTERQNLRAAIDSRTATGQATGILMHRYRLTAGQAFEILRRYSQDNNMKLHDLAETIILTGEAPT